MSKSKHRVVRSEQEVGILCRVGNVDRFEGRFKERFSDFHVNEIDLNGKIVQLTSLSPPAEKKSDITEDDPEICHLIPDSDRTNIQNLQKRLEECAEKQVHRSDPAWREKVEVKVTNLGKEERTRIHKWLGNYDKLYSETTEKDSEKFIVVLYDNKNNRNRRRPATRAKYTHCVLYKEGVDTSEAIGLLTKKLRIKPSFITYCGTKDKYGKTTQRICVSNIDAHRLAQVSKEARGIKLGNYEYLPHHLRLGDLKGNHFKILLRNVKADSDDSIIKCIESLKSIGFINYFGLQRFGSYQVSTHAIGKKILQNKWIEAFDLILHDKPNDPDFMKKAKELWFKKRDPAEAIKKFPHWHRSIESSLLHGLAKYYSKNDYIGCFLRLPRNVRHLYIHSLQSYLWNRLATYRIQEMGTQPAVGDLVFVDKNETDFYFEEENEASDDEGSEKSSDSHLLARSAKVKTLTEQELKDYSIFDVLIPMQGTQITIPDNYIKTFYEKLLDEEGIEKDCFLKFKPISDQPKGAYRKLCVLPQNLSYKIVPYDDSDNVDNFIPSEIDKLTNKTGETHDSSSNGNGKAVNVSEKDKKCVILELSLPSSCYATMALREIIVSDAEQAGLEYEDSNEAAGMKRSVDEMNEDHQDPHSKRVKEDEETSEPAE